MMEEEEMFGANISYSGEQQEAIELCADLSNKVVGVTGGAGTGKTTVLREVYKEIRGSGVSVALVAPTGRAAKRIREATGIHASTIHRLLEFPKPDGMSKEQHLLMPLRGPGNPIPYKVVVVDEASMLGPVLHKQLVDAMPRGGVLRFFGDNNQLPPVESGDAPFKAVLRGRASITLHHNYRSDDEIVANAWRILKGQTPERNSKFELIISDNPPKALGEVVDDFYTKESHQVITPQRKGTAGTNRLNPGLQLKFNRNGAYLRLDRLDEDEPPVTVRANDKVLWVQNDYTFDLYNGETGVVEWIDTEDGSLGLYVDGFCKTIPPRASYYHHGIGQIIHYDPRKQLELGYAITTHKSQGSEFDEVIYMVTGHNAWLLSKNNFYTAVTRARHRVIVITDRKGLWHSLRPPKQARN